MIGKFSSALAQRSSSGSCISPGARPSKSSICVGVFVSKDSRNPLAGHALLNTVHNQPTPTSHVHPRHSRFCSPAFLAAGGDSPGESFREDLAESQSEKISDLADVDRTVELLMWVGSSIRWPWQAQVFPSVEEMSGEAQTSEDGHRTGSSSSSSEIPSSLSRSAADAFMASAEESQPSTAQSDSYVSTALSTSSPTSALLASAAITMQALSSSSASDSATSSSSSNSQTARDPTTQAPLLETAIFGGGCFWCLDTVFRQLRGVTKVQSGFSGGHVENPSYKQVMDKKSGHAEVVQLIFDPSIISYNQLLKVFFAIHDPTQRDRQGADMGPQYRSAVFYHSQQQYDAAKVVMAEVSAANTGWFSSPVVTQLAPAGPFWVAENYHQNFTAKNPMLPYCAIVAGPKVAKVRSKFSELLKDRNADSL